MQIKKVIVCPDSFKGSLTAEEASEAICNAFHSLFSDIEIVRLPMGDGGEGTLQVIAPYLNGRMQPCTTFDPLLRPVEADILFFNNGKSAYIESASCCGLTLINSNERDPLRLTTEGLGVLVNHAIAEGCEEVFIGLGGSATIDGGTGMLEALGWRFLDKSGTPLKGIGANLEKIHKIENPSGSFVDDIKFHAVCDVQNPLYGPSGAVCVFGPQKGADRQCMDRLEKGMLNFSRVTGSHLGNDLSCSPGAGAAGGLGFAILSFLKGDVIQGADTVLDLYNFDKEMKDADLVITGEGRIDSQSLGGKVSGAILKRCFPSLPVIAVAGEVRDREKLIGAGFRGVYSVEISTGDFNSRLLPSIAFQNLYETIRHIFKTI